MRFSSARVWAWACVSSLVACARPEPLVIAHRGLPGAFPGNSLASLVAAAAEGADTIEIDLWDTADGELMVAHDGRLECFTTDCDGAINERALSEVIACSLPPAHDGGAHPVPGFDAFLTATADLYERFFIELKTRGDASLQPARTAVRQAHGAGVYERTVWHSFDTGTLLAVRAAAKEQGLPPPVLGLQLFLRDGLSLNAGCPPVDAPATLADRFAHDFDWLLFGGGLIDEADVRMARAHGYRVGTWGGDSPALVRQALELRVDGIFTDHPAFVRRVIAGW